FFQFWLNTDDRDVVRYLKFFTWLDRPAIDALAKEVAEAPERREAQRVLAREVTAIVHGASAMQAAERASAVLFGSSLASASADEMLTVFDEVPAIEIGRDALESGVAVVELVTTAGLASSKGEATRLIRQGGLYLNDQRVVEE